MEEEDQDEKELIRKFNKWVNQYENGSTISKEKPKAKLVEIDKKDDPISFYIAVLFSKVTEPVTFAYAIKKIIEFLLNEATETDINYMSENIKEVFIQKNKQLLVYCKNYQDLPILFTIVFKNNRHFAEEVFQDYLRARSTASLAYKLAGSLISATGSIEGCFPIQQLLSELLQTDTASVNLENSITEFNTFIDEFTIVVMPHPILELIITTVPANYLFDLAIKFNKQREKLYVSINHILRQLDGLIDEAGTEFISESLMKWIEISEDETQSPICFKARIKILGTLIHLPYIKRQAMDETFVGAWEMLIRAVYNFSKIAIKKDSSNLILMKTWLDFANFPFLPNSELAQSIFYENYVLFKNFVLELFFEDSSVQSENLRRIRENTEKNMFDLLAKLLLVSNDGNRDIIQICSLLDTNDESFPRIFSCVLETIYSIIAYHATNNESTTFFDQDLSLIKLFKDLLDKIPLPEGNFIKTSTKDTQYCEVILAKIISLFQNTYFVGHSYSINSILANDFPEYLGYIYRILLNLRKLSYENTVLHTFIDAVDLSIYDPEIIQNSPYNLIGLFINFDKFLFANDLKMYKDAGVKLFNKFIMFGNKLDPNVLIFPLYQNLFSYINVSNFKIILKLIRSSLPIINSNIVTEIIINTFIHLEEFCHEKDEISSISKSFHFIEDSISALGSNVYLSNDIIIYFDKSYKFINNYYNEQYMFVSKGGIIKRITNILSLTMTTKCINIGILSLYEKISEISIPRLFYIFFEKVISFWVNSYEANKKYACSLIKMIYNMLTTLDFDPNLFSLDFFLFFINEIVIKLLKSKNQVEAEIKLSFDCMNIMEEKQNMYINLPEKVTSELILYMIIFRLNRKNSIPHSYNKILFDIIISVDGTSKKSVFFQEIMEEISQAISRNQEMSEQKYKEFVDRTVFLYDSVYFSNEVNCVMNILFVIIKELNCIDRLSYDIEKIFQNKFTSDEIVETDTPSLTDITFEWSDS